MRHQENARPILVTGSHRSGTTFVGKILSTAPNIGYIREPFNKETGVREIDKWYPYMASGMAGEDQFRAVFNDVLSGRSVYRSLPRRQSSTAIWRVAARKVLRNRSNLDRLIARYSPTVKRYLIKDPFAAMAAEYLHISYNTDVVVMMRHPAAFVASLKRMHWTFDFAELASQPELMSDHLEAILPAELRQWRSMSEGGAILWRCIYSVLDRYVQRNPGIILVRHEDLSKQPVAEFDNLFRRLGLTMTPSSERRIIRMTSAKNPANPVSGVTHTLSRDSRKNAKRWKSVLSASEIDEIKALTTDLSARYYDAGDW